MNHTATRRASQRISEPDSRIPPMDQTDWQMLEIEAGMGGVSPDTARAVIHEADELLNQPDVTLDEILPAAKALLAMLRRHVPPPPR